MSLTIGFGFAGGVLTVLQARALSQVVDRVFLGGEALSDVALLLELLLVIFLLRAIVVWSTELAANGIARQVKLEMRQRLYRHYLALGPAYVRDERTGELTHVVTEGVEALDAYFSKYLPQLSLAALVPLIVLVFVFRLDILSGLVLLLTAPLIPIFMVLIGNLAQSLTQKQWLTLSRMSAYFLDVLQGLTTLKILGRSREQLQVLARFSERYRHTTMQVLRVTFLSALALELVATLSTALVAVEIGLRLLYNQFSFDQAFFILILAPEFYLPLRMLGTRFHAGMSGVAAAGRIFEILEKPVTSNQFLVNHDPSQVTNGQKMNEQPIHGEHGAAHLPSVTLLSSRSIRFDGVYYTYPDGRQALKGVSFQIGIGQKVALVGPSGSGKSTVAHLLLRFLEPQAGRIYAGDVLIQSIPAREWRAQVAWVSQDPYLFHESIAENIRLAKPEASLDQVRWAAQQAHAHDFILSLPQGYDTPIGERGARLSAGQAQRIALARAFLKNAPLLILDEPTSSLDPQTEAWLVDAVDRLVASRTVLIIAHRLNTIYQADNILVLAEGRLVQVGTHRSLLEQEGLYRRLVKGSGEIA